MRVRSAPSTVPLLMSVLAVVLFVGSCQGERPVAPDAPASTPAGREGSAHATGEVAGNQPPTAVFKTRPPADDASVITGGNVLDVTFNMCQSSDPDPGDELRFSYDWDNDGKEDEYGHCRATHTYRVGEFDSACVFTKVCVSDRQPDHNVCHTYQVCTFGKSRPGASPSGGPEPGPSPTSEPGLTEQHEEGHFAPPGSRDIWSFTTSAATDVTVKLDTVSQPTAYIMWTCVSTRPTWLNHLTPTFSGRVPCAFRNPLRIGCPVRSYSLPNAGTYYILVYGLRPGSQGLYTLTLTAHPGTGLLRLDFSGFPVNSFPE
jgi:hypothetical protein